MFANFTSHCLYFGEVSEISDGLTVGSLVVVKQNKTALMIAAQNGHYKVMAYLLRIGVNPNAQDSSLNTPIHYASAYGWYHCVQLLLEAGANPSVANNWKVNLYIF